MTPSKRLQNGARRPYHRHGQGLVTKALPYLLERVADEGLPDEALTPLEVAARAWRREAEQDLGGELAATKRALLDAATGSMILLASLDRYVFELAEEGGLVNRRSRRVFPVVESRMRVADGLARQMQALGLDRAPRPTPSLQDYLAERYSGENGATAAGEETTSRNETPRSAQDARSGAAEDENPVPGHDHATTGLEKASSERRSVPTAPLHPLT